MRSGLKKLLAPLSLKQFREEYWQRRHYVARSPRGLLQALATELEGFDVQRLLERQTASIQAWFSTLEGEFRAVEVSRAAGTAAFEAGATLYLPQTGVPALMAWQKRLARDLGHSQASLTCSVFAARRGAGTRCHFDTLENFTIQLRGTKRWHVLPNRHLQAPLDNWVTGDDTTPEMDLYCDGPLPKDMPGAAESIELQPGDVLYVPRGYWHSVEASEDSVSLFLGFPVTPAVDLVLNTLRSRLLQDAMWRENFIDASAGPAFEPGARAQMSKLLDALKMEVAELSVENVIGWNADPPAIDAAAVFHRNPIATLHVHAPHPDEPRATILVHRGLYSRQRILAFDRQLLPLCRWIARRRTSFSLTDCNIDLKNVPAESLRELLRHLVRCGLLHVAREKQPGNAPR
jgi:hypothetical protein